jgi:hypothetical protein
MEEIVSNLFDVKKNGVPWEEKEKFGFFYGYFLTCREVIFSPKKFFSERTFKPGTKEPFLFSFINLLLLFFMYALVFYLLPDLPDIIDRKNADFIGFVKKIFTSKLFLIFIPSLSAALLYIVVILYNISLYLIGSKKGFVETFQVVGYCSTSLFIYFIPLFSFLLVCFCFKNFICIVPIFAILGNLVILLGEIWPLVILNIGFRYRHEISYYRTIVVTVVIFKTLILILFLIFSYVGIFLILPLFR